MIRASITPPDVRERVLPGQVGYLALSRFGPDAGEALHTALAHLRAAGSRATVLDLRGNGGGYETAAVRVASAFVPSGAIVLTQTNHGRREVTNAGRFGARAAVAARRPRRRRFGFGSELVTAAIADHGLGKVVGTRTFGKGVVQSMFPLPDGSRAQGHHRALFHAGGARHRPGRHRTRLYDRRADGRGARCSRPRPATQRGAGAAGAER